MVVPSVDLSLANLKLNLRGVCRKRFPLTLQCKLHDTGVQGIHFRVHVRCHAEEIGCLPHWVLREGALGDNAQAVERRALCRSWGLGGHAHLRLDWVMQWMGLQRECPDWRGLQLRGVVPLGHG